MKQNFKENDSPITILFDFWSSSAGDSYLGIVYSYVDIGLFEKTGLLSFSYFEGRKL